MGRPPFLLIKKNSYKKETIIMLNANKVLENKVMEVLGGNQDLTNKVLNTVFDALYGEVAKAKTSAYVLNKYKVTIYPTSKVVNSSNNKTVVSKSNKVKPVAQKTVPARFAIIGPDDEGLKQCISIQDRIRKYIENCVSKYKHAEFITFAGENNTKIAYQLLGAINAVNKHSKQNVAKLYVYMTKGVDNPFKYSSDVTVLQSTKPIINTVGFAQKGVVLLANKNSCKEHHQAIQLALAIEKHTGKKFMHVDIGDNNVPPTTPTDDNSIKNEASSNQEASVVQEEETKQEIIPAPVENDVIEEVATVPNDIIVDNIQKEKQKEDEIVELEQNESISTIDKQPSVTIDYYKCSKQLEEISAKHVSNIDMKYAKILKTFKGDADSFQQMFKFYFGLLGYTTNKKATLTSLKDFITLANRNDLELAVIKFCEKYNIDMNSPAGSPNGNDPAVTC